ncbi:recombinase family protein [Niameybacter sp.]|uniref:recombinase family protein n=1 Tax=Niameybacter sp. TaxID=2033640 RepID=UPI002FCA703E
MIFDKYLELGSISKVETYLLQNGIKTPKQANFSSNVIRNILINPVYTVADATTYDYFNKLECILPKSKEDFNGTYGLMPYNRHKKGKSNLANPKDKWIISIGTHMPIISSIDWIKAQKQLKANSDLAFSNTGTSPALLSGLLYCKHCGSVMQVAGQGVLADGTVCYNYRCTTKTKSRGKLCNSDNISKGYAFDALVVKRVRKLIDAATLHQKKTLMRNLIKRIEWDGTNADIFFYFNQSPL